MGAQNAFEEWKHKPIETRRPSSSQAQIWIANNDAESGGDIPSIQTAEKKKEQKRSPREPTGDGVEKIHADAPGVVIRRKAAAAEELQAQALRVGV